MLTEEQINYREDIFIHLIECFVNDYSDYLNVVDDYTPTVEDMDLIDNVMAFFVENYKEPTLEESVLEDITGFSVNYDLCETLAEMFLDETIGDIVAGLSSAGFAQRSATREYKRLGNYEDKLKKDKDSAAMKALKSIGKRGEDKARENLKYKTTKLDLAGQEKSKVASKIAQSRIDKAKTANKIDYAISNPGKTALKATGKVAKVAGKTVKAVAKTLVRGISQHNKRGKGFGYQPYLSRYQRMNQRVGIIKKTPPKLK